MASGLNKIRNGKMIGNGADRKIVLGFRPVKVEVENVTDRIGYSKLSTMEDKKSIKQLAAGTKTYVDSVTINADGFTVEAAEFVATKEFHYVAYESKSE